MDTPDHKLPQEGIAQEPMREEGDSREQFDENGDPITSQVDLSLEHREQLEEDQRHNRDGDLEYRQGGDASDENGDPTFEAARDLERRATGSGVTRDFEPVEQPLGEEDLERERLKANSSI
jgi:hypothetical protein